MNFLAHCLIGAEAGRLQPARGPLIAGGFLGDFVKGTIPTDMPESLAIGVRLHRRVDAYSNRQPLIRVSCERFPAPLRRFAPVFVDIIADHVLACAWSDHHDASLDVFTGDVYDVIESHRDWLPEPGAEFLDYARDTDLFARYRHWSVIERSLHSVARRIRRPELGAEVAAVSVELLDDLTKDFDAYFPDILRHAREWIGEHGQPFRVR